MIMAVLGTFADFKPPDHEDILRVIIASCFALVFHLLLFWALMFKQPERFEVKEDVIAIELVTLPPKPAPIEAAEKPPVIPPDIKADPAPPPPPNIKPKASPIAPLVTSSPPSPAPDILASSTPAITQDEENRVPLPDKDTFSTPEPSASANERRIDEGLKALAADLSCLNGFSTECAETRKDVFKELQLTGTEKVYTKKYAHTGLPVAFYGLSERQIREKLGLHFAGENGIVIIPGLIAIDGNWWDAMHGVNKKCEWKFAASSSGDAFARSGEGLGSARHGVIKDCPDYLPAAKEDRDRRNKFRVRLEANEARRIDENQP